MNTYIWSVHDKTGKELKDGKITTPPKGVINLIKEIEKKFNINIDMYHEFRIKQKV